MSFLDWDYSGDAWDNSTDTWDGYVLPNPPLPPPPNPNTYESPFTYLFCDFLTGNFLGTLPLSGVNWSQQLNSAGTLQGSINLADARVRAMNPAGLTAPGRTMVLVDYKGSIVWAGWSMTARPFTRSSRVLSYTATELWSYFGRRVQATDYSAPPYSGIYPLSGGTAMPIWGAASTSVTNNGNTVETGWDPLLIGAQVINDILGYSATAAILNGNPAGGMQLALNGTALSSGAPTAYLASGTNTPSSDYVAVNFPYVSFQKGDAILQQLMGLGYGVGFDAGIDVKWTKGIGSPILTTINLAYPRRGRTFTQNNVTVQVAGSGRDYTVTPDASSMANTLYEIGGQNAVVISQNVNPLLQGYALFEDTASRSQIQSSNVVSILTQLGLGDLYIKSYPSVTFTVKVPLMGPDPTLGQFIVGDDCRLLIDPDPLFPSGLDSVWRITGYQVNLPDQGDQTMTLTLSQPPVYPLAPAV